MTHIDQGLKDQSVCILGLGYVGLTLATVMAGLGFSVTGIEVRPDVLRGLQQGRPHFFEPGLEGRLKRAIEAGKITFHDVIPADTRATVFIITVGTPLGADGKASMHSIEAATRQVVEVLKPGDMVILRSTVKSGTTRKIVLPLLAKAGVPFDLTFCPERTLEGKALIELRQLPQIVGGLDRAATVRAAQLFQFITPTVVQVSDIETAEFVKLIDNSNRDIMFGYANEVARACDLIGISAVEVIQAGKLGYPRTNLPLPGLVGGPCLEKDPYILAEGLEDLGMVPEITLAARRANERQPNDIAAFLAQVVAGMYGMPTQPVIALLGLAFKGQPPTDDLRGTMAKPVLAAMKQAFPGAAFRGWDAVVQPADIASLGLAACSSMADAMQGANVVLILNNHPEFQAMPIEALSARMASPGIIYDVWNHFTARELSLAAGVGYVGLGSRGQGTFPEVA